MKKNIRYRLITTTAAILSLSACLSTPANNQKTLWIAPEPVACIGGAPRTCLQVLEDKPDAQWQLHNSGIGGFKHEPGHFYQLKVSREIKQKIGADQSEIVLTADNIITYSSGVLLPNSMLTTDRKWLLKSMLEVNRLSAYASLIPPYISISDDAISGFSGCNRFFGQNIALFERANSSQSLFNVGNIASTRMMCPTPIKNLEHKMLAMLKQANRVAVNWPMLTLYQGDKELAKFVAADRE